MQEALLATDRDFLIVGVGASAGGLDALEKLLLAHSVNSGVSIVIVQHLAPNFKSLMPELLQRKTKLPIRFVTDGVTVEPNTVYLLPPGKEMIISEGRLLLTDKESTELLSLPIDKFLRSLAQYAGDRAVAVILSGTGSDGSRGATEVHRAKGLVIVQSENSAQFNGMPRSVRETGVVDADVPVEEIPDAISRYQAIRTHQEGAGRTLVVQSEIENILELLRQRYDVDFSGFKLGMINRRIERRLMLCKISSVSEYLKTLESDTESLEDLFQDLLIGVTEFFRDPDAFKFLAENVLPEAIRKLEPREEFRIWCVPCASGEEAYSLAMTIDAIMRKFEKNNPFKIFATDVHKESLRRASAGIFSSEEVECLTEEQLDKYFVEKEGGFQVCPHLRRSVVFAHHDVTKDAPFTKLHFVSCRNLFIYFQPALQRKVLSLFHFGLKVNGLLWMGLSEGPSELAEEFEALSEDHHIYSKSRDVRLSHLRMPVSSSTKRVTPGSSTNQQHPSHLLETYDKMLESFIPPAILITETRELAHVFGGASKYFARADGRPTSDAVDLLDPSLQIAATTAIQRALKEKEPVTFAGIPWTGSEDAIDLRITVRPFANQRARRTDLLISFEESEALLERDRSDDYPADSLSAEQIRSLEDELRYAKESLQTTIQELKTANGEMQSANEELTAANEELQSTNEELHSVNEELYTVNAEHQRKITELTELTDDMENLLDSIRVDTIFLDRALTIRKFTLGIAKTFRLIPQDVGRRIDDFSHDIEYDSLLADIEEVLDTERPRECEVQDRIGNWYLMRLLPYSSRGEVCGVLITLIDIMSLKEAEKKLAEMSEIVQHSDDAIFRIGLDGSIGTWNAGARKLYGYDEKEMVGESLARLVDGHARGQITSAVARARRGEIVDHLQMKHERLSGERIDVSMTLSPIIDTSNNVVGASAVIRDITQQKKAEGEVRRAVQLRDQFLAMLSHELRNPLAAVINAASLLDEDALDVTTDLDARKVIKRNVRHVAHMLDDLLDVSRVTHGKITLNREVFDLRDLVSDVVSSVQRAIDSRGQSLAVHCIDQPCMVKGDPVRIQQAQVNLLVNASKYTQESGAIRYSLTIDANDAVISIGDNGQGILPSLMASIFDPFVQSDQEISRSNGGMGLGLSIVKIISEAHNGQVLAMSDGRDRGSEFTIRLPLCNEAPTPKTTLEVIDLSSKRLLIVEDNEAVCDMLALAMEYKGFEVATAHDALSALEIIDDFSPDIAVFDIGLPDLSGYELARRVRALGNHQDITLFALTGYGQEHDQRSAQEAGFDLHLVKPLDPEDLRREIALFLQAQET